MMNLTFTSRSVPECEKYLYLVFQGQQFLLDEFSEKFKTHPFQLETILPECSFLYRGKELTYEEYQAARIDLSNQLKLSQRHRYEVFKLEPMLAISNFDYYKSAKFLEKAESCLQSARLYLMRGANIIDLDCNIPWKYGYQGIFDIRTINLTTAIIWYNNCFDYVLQIAFLAYELYRGLGEYKPEMDFEDILRLCSYKNFTRILKKNAQNSTLADLARIVEYCHSSLSNVNIWANYAKHKGGIGYIGLNPECPFQIVVSDKNGNVEARTSEFEAICLDADQCIPDLVAAHQAICKCISDLVDFIDYPQARYTLDENQRITPLISLLMSKSSSDLHWQCGGVLYETGEILSVRSQGSTHYWWLSNYGLEVRPYMSLPQGADRSLGFHYGSGYI